MWRTCFPETPPEGPPVGENQAPPEFDVEMQPDEDDDPMDVAISWLQDHALYALCSKPEVLVASKSSEGSKAPRTKPLGVYVEVWRVKGEGSGSFWGP